jgi:hypothetical protein
MARRTSWRGGIRARTSTPRAIIFVSIRCSRQAPENMTGLIASSLSAPASGAPTDRSIACLRCCDLRNARISRYRGRDTVDCSPLASTQVRGKNVSTALIPLLYWAAMNATAPVGACRPSETVLRWTQLGRLSRTIEITCALRLSRTIDIMTRSPPR